MPFLPKLGNSITNRSPLHSGGGISGDSFLFTVDTTQAGSAADTFILPLQNGATNIVVKWGDGSDDAILTYILFIRKLSNRSYR